MKKVVLHNSDGAVIKEMPYGKENNFERITANIETLAAFLADRADFCVKQECEGCGIKCKGMNDKQVWEAWLRQEAE